MAVQTIADWINTYVPKFEKKLLDHAIALLRLAQFAQKTSLPASSGHKEVKFFRPVWEDKTGELTEGVTPTDRSKLTFESVDATLKQIGNVAELSDLATATNLFNLLQTAHTFFGEYLAKDTDTRLRDLLINPTTGLTKTYAQKAASFTDLQSKTITQGKLHPFDIEQAVTKLKVNRAPTINGSYVVVACPQVISDMLRSPIWRGIVQFKPEKVFKGEIGELYGAKLIDATNPQIEKNTEGVYDDSGVAEAGEKIFSTQVLGANAYGVVDMTMKNSSSPWKPSIIVNASPDKSDPLNQRIVTGWKAYWGGAMLNKTWGINIRSKSSFDTSEAFLDEYAKSLAAAFKAAGVGETPAPAGP